MKTRRHRFWIGLNNSTSLLLAAAIVLMINFLSYRHYTRVDWSGSQRYALSPKTVSLLQSLQNPVNITVFFQANHIIREDILNLLEEYKHRASQNINILWVDPDREIALAEEMALKYEVSEPNVVVVEYRGRSKYVRADEIAQIDASSGLERMMSFRGEQAFSSAIQGVVQQVTPVVYFLSGHGERDINNFDQRNGFSRIRQFIERDNAEARTLELSVEKQIPDDCAALIIADASQSMSDTESELIGAWLRRSGRLMLLTDAGHTSGLEPLLYSWGVQLRNDVVFDPNRSPATGREVYVSGYGQHPVTEKLSNAAANFHLPRSVEPINTQVRSADRPQVTPLAFSSDGSWSESHPEQSPAKYDAASDVKGPISLAVAVEKGAPAGLLEMEIRPSRIVVFGDSGFVSNDGLTGSNVSLFLSSLNWLLNREELMAIAPKQIDDTRLKLTRTDARILFWSTVGGIPALAALLGLVLWTLRRK